MSQNEAGPQIGFIYSEELVEELNKVSKISGRVRFFDFINWMLFF